MAHYQQDFFPADRISAELPAINRQAGLAHLEKFVPLAGSSYTKGRNLTEVAIITVLSRACLHI